MKNNNKNRKLKFIRDKNNLRLGVTKFYCIEKVSNQLKEQSLSEDYISRLIETAKKSLMKTYKLVLGNVELMLLNYDGDDFIKDFHTNRVILSRGQGMYIRCN
jgi:hypothetical protein